MAKTKLIGKQVNDKLYLHYWALPYLPAELAKKVDEAEAVLDNEFPHAVWNVVRVHLRENRVAFLHYPGFRSFPHPALRKSHLVGRLSKWAPVVMTVTCYDPTSPSVPILHRKEAFLPVEDDDFGLFAALTAQEEAAGLFKYSSAIGFKGYWDEMLKGHHLTIDRHVLHYRGKPATDVDCRKIRAGIK